MPGISRTRIAILAVACAVASVVVAAPITASATAVTPIMQINSPFSPSNDAANQRFADSTKTSLAFGSLSRGIFAVGTDKTGTPFEIEIDPPKGKPLATGHFAVRGVEKALGTVDPTKPSVAVTVASEGGAFYGDLDILDLGWNSAGAIERFDIVLEGVGEVRMAEPEPAVVLGARTIAFRNTPVGYPATHQREWLHNTSGSSVAIGAFSVSGFAKLDFGISGDGCSNRTLAPGATCSFLVGYSPTAAGPRTAALTVPTGSTVQKIALAGTAPLGTSSISFSGSDVISGGTSHVISDGPYLITQSQLLEGWKWEATDPHSDTVATTALFTTPDAQPLVPGHHPTEGPSTGLKLYGQSLSAFGFGCGANQGSEDVNTFVLGADGLASRANIAFTQYCTSDLSRPMTGQLLWQWRTDVTAPAAPAAVTISGATARWTASSSSDVTHTIARLVAGSGVGATPISGYPMSDGSGTSAAIPTVGAGTYTIAVFAVDGTGNASIAGTMTTTIGSTPPTVLVPTAPLNVSAEPGNGSVTIRFSAPASDGGAAITGYEVRSLNTTARVTGSTSPITVSGLKNGSPYGFAVVAINAAGYGAQSLQVNATPIAAAGPPPVVTAPASGAELLIDPGFESSLGAWRAFTAGVLTRVSSPVHGGTQSLQITATSPTVGLVGITHNTVVPSSVAGATYTVSCWVRPSTANLTVTARFLEYTQDFGSNIHLAAVTSGNLAAGSWTRVSASGIAARSGERMVPQLFSTNQTTSTGTITYDDCSVTRS